MQIPGISFFERNASIAPLFIRLIIGFHLIYGTQDNVLSWAQMLEFRDFLATRGVPYPLFAAHLSVYAQLICGALFIAGFATRPAGAVMVINFVAALLIAHRGDSYPGMFPALMMLAAACFFLFHGAGAHSVDDWLARRGNP